MLVGEWSASDNDATYSMIVSNDNTGELSAIGFEGDRESVDFSWEYIDESQNFLLISPQIYKGEWSFSYDSASDALFWDLDPDFCFERVCD